MNANQKNNKKISMVLSIKLSIDDYNAFLTLTRLEYETGLIKEESTSELQRFTIHEYIKLVIIKYIIITLNSKFKLGTATLQSITLQSNSAS